MNIFMKGHYLYPNEMKLGQSTKSICHTGRNKVLPKTLKLLAEQGPSNIAIFLPETKDDYEIDEGYLATDDLVISIPLRRYSSNGPYGPYEFGSAQHEITPRTTPSGLWGNYRTFTPTNETRRRLQSLMKENAVVYLETPKKDDNHLLILARLGVQLQ